MFDLEQAIADWRAHMRVGGIVAPAPLEELENHLREDIGNLMAAGQPPPDAFQIAVARVGSPGNVVAEFKKARPRFSAPVTLVSLGWAGVAVLCLVLLLGRWAEGKLSLLLTAHIFSVTMGYGTAFLAGGFGIVAVWQRRFGVGANDGQRFNGAIRWFTQISAGMVVAGFILGAIWTSQYHGRFFEGDPREIGGLCAAVWLMASAVIQRSRSKTMALAATLLPERLGIIGNIIVGLAWFGGGAMAHGYAAVYFWLLNVLLGVNVFFLGMTVMPGHKPGRNLMEM